MLFLSITQIDDLQAIKNKLDGVELRLDLIPSWNQEILKNLLNSSKYPFMFTLRKASHGGAFSGSEKEREKQLLELLKLEPPFMDLEYDMRKEFLEEVLINYPKTSFILSYHNFETTPEDLEDLFSQMSVYPAYQYKIAAKAVSTIDAFKMLLFGKKRPQVSVICMGAKGEFARVLAPIAGNVINYASLDKAKQTAPGQLSLKDLTEIYHFSSLNQDTAIYGLIGDPIINSQGHLYHNKAFAEKHLNAVYVKMQVEAHELPTFFSLAKELKFQGLSVTMPLKEAVLPFLDEMDETVKSTQASNTLLFKKGKIWGTNTDGIGALDAIEKHQSVHKKNVVLIGAGGAARSIAFEALSRGAEVWILNRTPEKAQELATLFRCHSGGLTDFPPHYDVLINCSPHPMPIDTSYLHPHCLVMDIVYVPKETPFLEAASRLGCSIVYGEEMFYNQAKAQHLLWKNNFTQEKFLC